MHLGLALIIVLLVETIGLWFLYNKLIIPADRMDAAVWVFHLSVISMVVTMTQVPYGACLIAHERMDMYAYTSLVDVFLKLVIVYALTLFDVDKLKSYSSLFFFTSMGMLLFYRWFCATRFEECRIDFKFDNNVFKPILAFSGWQLFANISISLSSNGILMLLNMFFSPAVVAARAISLQVNSYATQFMTNFRTAANPQIIKKYAAGDYDGSKLLLLESTKYCYYMMLVLALPIFLLSYEILYIWLSQVPEYCNIFLKLVLVQSMDFIPLYWSCFKITAISVPFPLLVNYLLRSLTDNLYLIFIAVGIVSALSVSICAWYFGIEKYMRQRLLNYLLRKLHINKQSDI